MLVAACAIVRDEEQNIGAWLRNMRSFADAVVVVDTGSVDGTRGIVEKSGARLFSFAWENDFAAAKNFALARAEELLSARAAGAAAKGGALGGGAGDGAAKGGAAGGVTSGDGAAKGGVVDACDAAGARWIAFLDADETFAEPAKVRGVLAAQGGNVRALAVPLVNLDGGAEVSRFPAIRLLRAGRNLRYAGRVHEQLYQSGNLFTPRFEPGLLICHTGYAGARGREKCERNLKLLREMERRGESPLVFRYLADALYGIGDYAAAERYARRAIEEEPPTVDGKQSLYLLVLDAMQAGGKELSEQLAFARAAREKHPEYLDFVAREGLLLWRMGEKDAAARLFREFLARLADDPLAQGAGATTARALVAPVKSCLAELAAAAAFGRLSLEEQYEQALALGARDVPLLFAALFCSGEKEGLAELPDAMQELVAFSRGEKEALSPAAADGYAAGLSAVLTFAPEEQIADYAALAPRFGWDCVLATAAALLAAEEWALAFSLLAQVPADAIPDAAKFWRMAGLALFHQAGQEAAARECFERARAAGADAREIAAYLAWLAARSGKEGGGADGES